MREVTPILDSDAGNLRARSLELLDFPAIREQVANHTTFGPSRKLALHLTPAYSIDDVERLQRETVEGLFLLEEGGDVALSSSGDALTAVNRAGLEGSLAGPELLAVAELLDVQHRARAVVLRVSDRVPTLAHTVEGITDLRDLQERITSCIGPNGEVLDSATPILGGLRRQVRQAYERVKDALEGIIQSPAGREALQDQVISMRGERLVLQVKTELRHRISGVVHDASNTGATMFVEPFATADLCNGWRELVLEEERETAGVLRDLSTLIGYAAEDISRGTELTARLDFILARARYSAMLGGVAALAPNPEANEPPQLTLVRARHPLLGEEAVPIDVRMGPSWSVLVITGPNTGGKTVAMKTVGVLALMHQSGLHIPAAEGSSLPVFTGIYADVGDQQSIQRSVSTFGSHMHNVIDILSCATPSSLVLFDELGTSTDPEEGSALAKAILSDLAARRVPTIATTHHRDVASHAQANDGMMNASVELDASTLRPTYHLTQGVPGRSYALSLAEQMGMPDEIMQRSRSLLEPQYLRFEDWLKELHNERSQLQARLREAEEARASAEATRSALKEEQDDLALRRDDILHSMREELVEQYDEVKKKLRRAEAALSWSAGPDDEKREHVSEAKADVESARQDLADRKSASTADRAEQTPLAVGDAVDIRGLDVHGRVISIPGDGADVEVAVGEVHLRLDANRLLRVAQPESPDPGYADTRYDPGPVLSTGELDLRGSRAEEALLRVEQFLDTALRDGLSSVRIIHGKGTGALRQAVRELLTNHPLAKSFGPETSDRGGDGATVVELM